MTEATCCPTFDPAPWDEKVFEWKDKPFIKDRVFTLFYVPINFGRVMKRLDKRIRQAGATVPGDVCLSDHTSKWNIDLYLAVDKDIPGAVTTRLSGRYFTKVYEGPYRETGTWCKDFDALAKKKGLDVRKSFMWYTTCPKCAKKYGKNYVAIVGQLN